MNILSNLLNHSRNDLNVSVASELKKQKQKKKLMIKKMRERHISLDVLTFCGTTKKLE